MRLNTLMTLILACGIFSGTATASEDYMRTSGTAEESSELLAVKRIYTDMTANVVRKIVGDQASVEGVAGKKFHEEINKDVLSFIKGC